MPALTFQRKINRGSFFIKGSPKCKKGLASHVNVRCIIVLHEKERKGKEALPVGFSPVAASRVLDTGARPRPVGEPYGTISFCAAEVSNCGVDPCVRFSLKAMPVQDRVEDISVSKCFNSNGRHT